MKKRACMLLAFSVLFSTGGGFAQMRSEQPTQSKAR